MKVQNLKNSNGNKIPNQFELVGVDGCRYFQSYDSIIVKIDIEGNVFLDEKYYNYSNTTSKCRNLFLNKTSKEIDKSIKSGVYILKNLN